MRRLFSLKTLVLILLAAGIGAVVALVVNQKKKFAGMSEDEIRSYLEMKLSNRMSDEQVAQIQDAVVSAVKGAAATMDDVDDAVVAVAEVARETADEIAEGAIEQAAVAEAVAEEAIEEAIETEDAAEALEETIED
jgi:SOS response regulatory protein OraA/RecX